MTGLGAVDTEPIAGAASPALPLANVLGVPQLYLGNVQLQVAFAGLTPGTVGIYQVNAVLPQPLSLTGGEALALTAAGQTTSIQLPIQ
jgi:uncharacterized protein (TIGR03437 family)